MSRFRQFIKESWSELKKVSWPTRIQVRNLTVLEDAVAGIKGAPGEVRHAQFSTRNVELEVETAGPSLLVLSQTYYHWWQACVNGQPAPIWRANYAFQAVEIPPGTSTVKLVYRDKGFYSGMALSIVTLLGCLIGLRRAK